MIARTIPWSQGVLHTAIALAALTLLPGAAPAQNKPAPAPTTPPPALASEPYYFDSIGLTLNLPLNARMEATRVGGKTTAAIRADDATWMINVQVHDTANEAATIGEALNQTIALIQETYGRVDPNRKVIKDTKAKVVDRVEDLRVRDQPAARAYMLTPTGDGKHLFRGYTIFKPLPKQFVVFELVAPSAVEARARQIYELTVASAIFRDPALLALERGAAVKAGVRLLAGLGAADFETLMDKRDRWYRHYRPAPGGGQTDAEELGYRSLRAWKGQLGEIDPTKGKHRWGAAEREQGYLVRVAGRHLVRENYADFEGFYFLSPDRQREAWSLRTVVRNMKGDELVQAGESAYRHGDELEISISETGQPTRTIRPLILGEGYTSQVENHLMPFILARAGLEADFAFYVYQSVSETIALRRDSVKRDPAMPAALVVTTQYRAEEEPRRAILNAEGEMTRSDTAEGTVWEPCTPDKLHEMWRRKGLPTGRPR